MRFLSHSEWEAGVGLVPLPPADETEDPLATPTPLEPMEVVSNASSQEAAKKTEFAGNDQSMDTSSSGSLSLVTATVTSAASFESPQTPTVSMANIVTGDLPLPSNPVTCQQSSSPPIDMLTTAPVTTTSQTVNISNSSSSPTMQLIPNSAHPTPSSTIASVLSSVPNSTSSTSATTTPCPSSVQSTPSKSPPDTTRDELPPTLRFLIEAHQHLGRLINGVYENLYMFLLIPK